MTCILIGPFILCHYLVYLRLYNIVQSTSKLQTEDAWMQTVSVATALPTKQQPAMTNLFYLHILKIRVSHQIS